LLELARNFYAGRLLAAVYLGSITLAVFFIIRAAAERFAAIRRKVQSGYAKVDSESSLLLEVQELKDRLAQALADKTAEIQAVSAQWEERLKSALAEAAKEIEAAKAAAQSALAQFNEVQESLDLSKTEAREYLNGIEQARKGAEEAIKQARAWADQEVKQARALAEQEVNKVRSEMQAELDRVRSEMQAELEKAHNTALEAQAKERVLDYEPTQESTPLKAQVIEMYREGLRRGERMKPRVIAERLRVPDRLNYIEQTISKNRAAIEQEVESERNRE
jgi:ElaB/YqjD/DUF883 family membrane-anchored ribosome-binding protein